VSVLAFSFSPKKSSLFLFQAVLYSFYNFTSMYFCSFNKIISNIAAIIIAVVIIIPALHGGGA